MGAVWRAWDERLERWVALKQIRADVTLRHGRERLWREARAVARLNHPSIVHVYDILEGAEADWIVMELVAGKTVRDLLDQETSFPPSRAAKLGREIAEGLAEAHAQGILHRDLKATNVIVTPAGRAKILDFGLAKEMPGAGGLERRDPTLSIPGHVLGTAYAMSPEQALGRALDERSDLFSLGSLLYEMLTGRPPFWAETAALSVSRVVDLKLPPLQRSHPQIPSPLCELVDWLLQKAPQDRPRSACEVLAALASATSSADLGTAPALAPASSAQLAESEAETLVQRPFQPAASSTVPREGERRSSGERRTVTIACCALVRPDRLSGEGIDIEVLSEAMLAFERLAQEVCEELSGSLGAVLNRMLWLCFGYPQAHENDAERAVRAVREIQDRFAALPIAAAHRLAVRAGVHTGPAVVVSRTSAGPSLQAGDTFDIAMAIQCEMPAGRIGASAASRRLLRRKFATQALPAVHLRDLDATVAIYEVGPALEPGSREGGRLPPLVNREAERQILRDRFRLACAGSGQAVLIAGEAGIGKSRLVRALSEQPAAEATWLFAHGSTFTQNTPLAPVLRLLSRLIFAADDSAEDGVEERIGRLEEVIAEHGLPLPEHAPLLGALFSIPTEGRYPVLVLSPEARRKRTLASILALLGAFAQRHPVVLVIEDLHWIDPSTLELLDQLLNEISVLPLLLVATFRPEFTAPWRHQTAVTQLNLGGLSQAHSAQLMEQVAEGKRMPSELHREIVARTDGIPLFVEELTKAVLEGDATLAKRAGIPLTLGGSLLARLDRLGEAKAVAQLAAVIGRTFTLEQLEALSWIKGADLAAALGRLLQAEILYRRGTASRTRYVFKHALIQDAAYLSLLESDRQQLHRRLVLLLQNDFPEVAAAEPERMAHHCERGGLTAEAVDYLMGAGLRAMQRSALLEAVSQLRRGLDLLPGLPAAPERAGRELALRSVLVAVLGAIAGWGAAEVGENAERCTALAREIGDRGRLIPSLYGLWAHHILRGDRQPSIGVADEIARLAETPVQVVIGCSARIHTTFYGGSFVETLALAEQAAALYEPNLLPEFAQVFGEESSLLPHVYHFWVLWILGRPEAAVRKRDAVLAAVEALRSPFLLGMAWLFEMILWHELRDSERVAAVADRLIGLARDQEFALLHALAHVGQGWAACQRGDLAAGEAQIRTGLDLHRATGARLPVGYWTSYLVDAQLASGRLQEGLSLVGAALARSETQLDVFFDAELRRLEGELLRASGDCAAAEAAFRLALGIAREQQARAFELRAATSLTDLLAALDRAGEALPILEAVYEAHPEGYSTPDLAAARQLLDRLIPVARARPRRQDYVAGARSSLATPSSPRTKSGP